jgi:hypothetical protein
MFFKNMVPRDLFVLKVTPELKSKLAQYATDQVNDPDTTKDMKPEDKTKILNTINGIIEGKQVGEPQLTTIRAAIASTLVTKVIDMFETNNTDPKNGIVNPCIREMNFDLVLSMFIAVVSAFLAVVSLGSAGLLGPVIQAIYWTTYTAPSAAKGLADLSK